MTKDMPEHLSTDSKPKNKQDAMDKQLQDSFPASDPPSYSGGSIGAPEERKSKPPTSNSHAVKAAERKVKDGSAKDPASY